jgi:hypothetical protein
MTPVGGDNAKLAKRLGEAVKAAALVERGGKTSIGDWLTDEENPLPSGSGAEVKAQLHAMPGP